jgi:tRNA pseudouridine55 synthase
MYSALKRNGIRLYELARQGVEVAREPRTVHIHALALLAHDAQTLTLDIRCSKGTYIRTLVEDIGEVLGCGAHVCALRRTGVGPYTEADIIAMEELEARAQQGFAELDALLRPIDSALSLWPALKLNRDMAYYARSGQAILVPGAPPTGWVRIYDERDAFLGVGRILDDGRMAPKRLMKAG